MKWDFTGKVAVVTGAGKGIGAATAHGFADGGAQVAVLDFDRAAGEALAAELGSAARFFHVDVSDPASFTSAVDSAATAFGGVDILVNCAGVITRHTIANMPVENWKRTLSVNLDSIFHGTKAVLPHMKARGGGAIVNIASVSGYRFSLVGGLDYTTSKWGVRGFTRQAAYELGQYGIRVNTVCPGPTLTPMIDNSMDPEERDRAAARFPLGRWLEPADIANGALFLASPAGAMCTGIDLVVDGGFLLLGTQSIEEYMEVRGDEAVGPAKTGA
jgi:NAD(P)-dependent dehydrogenase (short-subunit alcohol dehydrogenase family)